MSVMSNVYDSKKSFSNQKRTGLVGGCNTFLTFFFKNEGHTSTCCLLVNHFLLQEPEWANSRPDTKDTSVP